MHPYFSPQLTRLHSGKVRDSFALEGGNKRLIIVSSRISCFDKVLRNTIPGKGEALNAISNYWFKQTQHIIDNHFIECVAPNTNIVLEATPIKLEIIVRQYLTGSMWRAYEQGKRVFSGLKVADGMHKNQRFTNPIITPTTKEENDQEICPREIIEKKLIDAVNYAKIEQYALQLFELGSKILAAKNILLVDTKYEFGVYNGKIILIDEIHTPDSSRLWLADDYARNSQNPRSLDKENARQWLLANARDGKIPDALPAEIVHEVSMDYANICELITGSRPLETRLSAALSAKKIIKPGFVSICMGSKADLPFAQEICKHLADKNVFTEMRVVSAHKNGERIAEIANDYNYSLEPGVVIAVAGLSNGLGGALAANLNIPVINCPPFKSDTDLQLNLFSSLMMPSGAPALTILGEKQAAQAALRALNLPELRRELNLEIIKNKEQLLEDDLVVQRSSHVE